MPKGLNIFCLEGLWEENVEDKSTIQPILELLNKKGYCDHIYNRCATVDELEFYLNKWTNGRIKNKYPILYLAFHGKEEYIFLNSKATYSLQNIEEILGGQCHKKIIHFGSCSTLNLPKSRIASFIEKTDALAVIGYKTDIDWMLSTALDLFVFDALQYDILLDHQGIKKFSKTITSKYGNLHSKLKLRIEINPKRVVRKRVPKAK